MHLFHCAALMLTIAVVLFGFAEVEPPTGHALCRSGFVELPHPIHRLRIGSIDQSHVVGAQPSHVVHAVVGKKAGLLQRFIICCLRCKKRFGNANRFHVLCGKVRQHFGWFGEIWRVPIEIAHAVRRRTLPIEVEHQRIKRQPDRLNFCDNVSRFVGRVIAIARRQIPQCPIGRQFLSAGQKRIIFEYRCQRTIASDEIIGNRRRAIGFVRCALARRRKRCTPIMVVEKHAIPIGRNIERNADIMRCTPRIVPTAGLRVIHNVFDIVQIDISTIVTAAIKRAIAHARECAATWHSGIDESGGFGQYCDIAFDKRNGRELFLDHGLHFGRSDDARIVGFGYGVAHRRRRTDRNARTFVSTNAIGARGYFERIIVVRRDYQPTIFGNKHHIRTIIADANHPTEFAVRLCLRSKSNNNIGVAVIFANHLAVLITKHKRKTADRFTVVEFEIGRRCHGQRIEIRIVGRTLHQVFGTIVEPLRRMFPIDSRGTRIGDYACVYIHITGVIVQTGGTLRSVIPHGDFVGLSCVGRLVPADRAGPYHWHCHQ